MDTCATLFAQSNGTLAIPGTAKLFGAGVTDCSALRQTLSGHERLATPAADLVIISFVEEDDNGNFTYLPLSLSVRGKQKNSVKNWRIFPRQRATHKTPGQWFRKVSSAHKCE